MLNLIKADLYKVFHRKYLYIFWALMLLTVVEANYIVYKNLPSFTVYDMLSLSLSFLKVPIYLIIILIDMTLADELKDNLLKNALSFGIPRRKLYVSKIITCWILAVLSTVLILSAFIGSAFFLLQPGMHFTNFFAASFVLRILCALPLYTAALTIGICLCVLIRNNMVFGFLYAAIFTVLEPLTSILSALVSQYFDLLHGILISTHIKRIAEEPLTNLSMGTALGLGVIYTFIFTWLGIAAFRKQDIK